VSALPDPLRAASRTEVWWRGRRLTYFGGCDYFRFASHPRVVAAANRAATKFGLGVAASRLTTGNHALYGELERELARFFGAEAARVAATGYFVNAVVAQGLAGDFTHVLLDEGTHPSLQDAVVFFGAPVIRFKHGSPEDAARRQAKLAKSAKTILVTDGVCSSSGWTAPLAAYRRMLRKNTWLHIDDCHGLGTVGAHGHGTLELEGVGRERLIQTGTLSKALGAFGGVLLASRDIVDRISERSRIFTGSTPPPLPMAAAALASLKLLRAQPALLRRLTASIRFVKEGLYAAGRIKGVTLGPICLVVPRDPEDQARLRQRLLRRHIFPSLVKYPGLPPGGAFRFGISSEHSPVQLTALVEAVTG
jgi:8-amino-7-oxononanoate synthase